MRSAPTARGRVLGGTTQPTLAAGHHDAGTACLHQVANQVSALVQRERILDRLPVASRVDPHPGEGWRGRRIGEVVGPDEAEGRRVDLHVIDPALLAIELLGPGFLLGRKVATEPLAERLHAAVADQPERINRHPPEDSVRHPGGDRGGEVSAPRVSDHPRPLDAEAVEQRDRVVDMPPDRVRPTDRARREAPLLVADRVDDRCELVGKGVQVGERQGRAAVEEKRGWAGARAVPDQHAAADRDLEALAGCHGAAC
jgi:hypothetical protein